MAQSSVVTPLEERAFEEIFDIEEMFEAEESRTSEESGVPEEFMTCEECEDCEDKIEFKTEELEFTISVELGSVDLVQEMSTKNKE